MHSLHKVNEHHINRGVLWRARSRCILWQNQYDAGKAVIVIGHRQLRYMDIFFHTTNESLQPAGQSEYSRSRTAISKGARARHWLEGRGLDRNPGTRERERGIEERLTMSQNNPRYR
jgi:hypothetical protein